jgi:hypothetical protein
MKKELLNSLLDWSSSYGVEGYDPYDIVSLNKFTRSLMVDFRKLNFFKKVIRFGIEFMSARFPIAIRKVFFVKKKIHPTHLGCMLHAYVLLSKGDPERYSKEIDFYRSELIRLRSTKTKHYAWGVPFSWTSSGVEFPEGTPFAVTANWIGSAFVELYELRNNQEDLDIAVSACHFILEDLKRTTFEDGTICFSYSMEKIDLINNANLFAADLLLKVGKIINNQEFIDSAKKAIDFTISTQLPSGLLPYTAHSESTFNDSYHASYELQCLFRAWKHFQDSTYLKAFNVYYAYYLKYYFKEDGNISKYSTKEYPIDSTSLADALILFAEIRNEVDVSKEVDKLFCNLRDNWQDKTGYFYYSKRKSNTYVKIPFIRWTQGWMALGLAHWYEE